MTLAPLFPAPGTAAAPGAEAAPAQAASAAAAADPADRAKATEAAVKFEGLFIREMLKQMRRSTREFSGGDALSGSQSQDGLLDVADMLLSDTLASQRAFGIADAVLRQLLPAGPQAAAAGPLLKFPGASAALNLQAGTPRPEAGSGNGMGDGAPPTSGTLP